MKRCLQAQVLLAKELHLMVRGFGDAVEHAIEERRPTVRCPGQASSYGMGRVSSPVPSENMAMSSGNSFRASAAETAGV